MKYHSMILVVCLSVLYVSIWEVPAADLTTVPTDQAKRDESFMAEALELARLSVLHGNEPFGAVLVKDGRVVARAENTSITDKRVSHHAEINVLDKAYRNPKVKTLEGHTLYASSEPCPMCSGAIFLAHVGTVVYGAPQGYLHSLLRGYEEIGLTKMTHLPDQHVEVRGPVLKQAAEKILADYVEAEMRKRAKP